MGKRQLCYLLLATVPWFTAQIKSQANNCYYGRSKDYQGTVNITKGGIPCQRWDSFTPHRHKYTRADQFTDGRLPENYCRNVITETHEPWCYTTQEKPRWDFCNVSKCRDCPPGKYGRHCVEDCDCGHHGCDYINGSCLAYCLPGWRGHDCVEECPDGKFGQNCTHDCHCLEVCNKQTGVCQSSCGRGWRGRSCQEKCPPELYGEDCRKECHCVSTAGGRCEQIDGRCLHGCVPGWTEEDCQQAEEVQNGADHKQLDKGSNGGNSKQLVEGMDGDNRQKSAEEMNGNHQRPKDNVLSEKETSSPSPAHLASAGDDSIDPVTVAVVAAAVAGVVVSTVGVGLMFTQLGQSVLAWTGLTGGPPPSSAQVQGQGNNARENTMGEDKSLRKSLFSKKEESDEDDEESQISLFEENKRELSGKNTLEHISIESTA